MNPFSWLGAGIIAGPAISQTAERIARNSSQFFGDLLLPTETPQASGLSEVKAGAKSAPRAERTSAPLFELKQKISDWLRLRASQSGDLLQSGDVSLDIKETSIEVQGTEPTRSELERYLMQSPDLVSDLIEAGKNRSPLAWLPHASQTNLKLELP
ncbi:MAG: hypothetical protein KGQ60_00300 [Planctomycetes bacterium]|nr:hypothetical protein [Planctomycetota bacterium]